MEALERSGKILASAAILLIVFWSQCKGVEGQRNNTKMSYVCPPDFIRLGHSCYYFSDANATWQNAFFACKDRDSNLSVPARWEDRNLRNYLNKNNEKSSRWIGGLYDYNERAWKWGGELRKMRYQSFSKMKKMTPDELQFHCIRMVPELLFRWAPRSCLEPSKYICQTKLRKFPPNKVENYRRRWQRMGEINEIKVPSIGRDVNDSTMVNDVSTNPIRNPKSFDLRPNPTGPSQKRQRTKTKANRRPTDLKKRVRPTAQRRLRRPFPGYTWDRRDPEGSYKRNADLLRSGRTGLSLQQIKMHLARLQRLRDKQIARRKRMRKNDDWLVNEVKPMLSHTRPRTYTIDNNISALHPKTIVEEFDLFPTPPPVNLKPARG